MMKETELAENPSKVALRFRAGGGLGGPPARISRGYKYLGMSRP